MILSVVIVSYNVEHFLVQCLSSLRNALAGIESEIIVVDNNSNDGTQAFLKSYKEPDFIYLINDINRGFSKAINQGISLASGKYTLVLNPDTLVGSEAITKCLKYLETHPKCGVTGVKLIDGQGNYLKESKRSVPTLLSSLFKFTGLSSLFHKSKTFSAYHLGHLDEDKNHKVQSLTGAFMLCRTSVLKQLQGFDERYFMYAEDIDLCLQISNAGYYNYYIGEESIVHFKGESTSKTELNYHYHFFNSMLLFVKKNLSSSWFFVGVLKFILLSLGLFNFVKYSLSSILNPLLRFAGFWIIIYFIGQLWATFYFKNPDYYQNTNHTSLVILYALIWTISYYSFSKKSSEIYRGMQGILIGTIVILVLYGLAPLEWRSSRAIILISGIAIIVTEFATGLFRFRINHGHWSLEEQAQKALLVGKISDYRPNFHNLGNTPNLNFIGFIAVDKYDNETCIGEYQDLEIITKKANIKVLTFITDSLRMEEVMKVMVNLGSKFKYLLYSTSSNLLIDSPNKNTQGLSTIVEIKWNIDSRRNRKLKRALDISLSLIFALMTPIFIWLINRKKGWLPNIRRTLFGYTSWVGYNRKDEGIGHLPFLRPGILQIGLEQETPHNQNSYYAREYNIKIDLNIILTSFKQLGNKLPL